MFLRLNTVNCVSSKWKWPTLTLKIGQWNKLCTGWKVSTKWPDTMLNWSETISIEGLDNVILQHQAAFLNNGVTGHQLLNFRADDLDNLGIKKIGHQEIILEAVEHLRNFVSCNSFSHLCDCKRQIVALWFGPRKLTNVGPKTVLCCQFLVQRTTTSGWKKWLSKDSSYVWCPQHCGCHKTPSIVAR